MEVAMRADRFLRRSSACASRGAICACLWFLGACTGAPSGDDTLSDVADASDFATAAPDDRMRVAMDATAGDLVEPDGAHTGETVGHDGDADAAADSASGGSDGTDESGDSPPGDQATEESNDTLDLPQVEYLATDAVGDQEAPEAGLKCPPEYNVPCSPDVCADDENGTCGSGFAYPCLLTTAGSDVELAMWFDDVLGGCVGHCAGIGVRHYRIDGATCTASLKQVGGIDDPACGPANFSIEPVVVGGRRFSVLWDTWHGPIVDAGDVASYPAPNVPPGFTELEVLAVTSDPGGELLCIVKVPLFSEDGLGLAPLPH